MVGSICRNGQVLVISAHHTVHRYTGTPHHVLSCESQRAPQWVGHHPPKKKALTKKKSIHNFSQLFTTFHIFSQLFTTFRQPSQFCSSFRVVKICENLSHFVKICEMHTPREAPVLFNITHIWCFPGGMHFTNFQFNSQLFTTIHNFSPPFFPSLVKLLNAGICISGIRPASGGVNLPKWTSSRHFRTVHSTQVHRYNTPRSIL